MQYEHYGDRALYLEPGTVTLEVPWEEKQETSNEKPNEDIAVTVEAEPKKAVRVSEILDLREENCKVFRMSDGTEQAVFYPEAVHMLDEDTNTFEEVDNTLVEEEDGRHYVNGKNHFKARFSREEENDELFSIESGMHRVVVSARKNSKQRNKGVQPMVRKKVTKGIQRTDALVFAGVQEGSDYEYSVTGNGVKENIIVKDKANVYRYSFIIRQENVTAQFDEANKRIAFISKETGEEVFFIPAPFMTDGNGVISTAVSYELKHTANSDVILNIVADSEWMNAEERAFPVVIDPQIQLSGSSAMTTYSWEDGVLYSSPVHTVGTIGCGDGTCNTGRMYMSFNIPTLPRNPRIKKAELKFYQASSSSACYDYPKFGLYRVDDYICTGSCTPYHDSNLIDFAELNTDQCDDGEIVSYTFDVTTLVDQINKGEKYINNLVLKIIDETSQWDNTITLYGSAYSNTYAPKFIVTYESSYGVNTSYRTHTHELGRFGQGSIDLQCGNLMFESEDFAWAGNRMPVTIKHLYNSALSAYQYTANSAIKLFAANFSAMRIGNGFKLNIMQSMTYVNRLPIAWTKEELENENQFLGGYIYVGENGEETYFKESDKRVCCDSDSQCYNLYEDVNGGDMLYDPQKRTLKQGDDTYQFDAMGRLVKVTDGAGNHMDIAYNSSNRIAFVTDGTGRDFWFTYSGNFLTSITAPDNTEIRYTYSGNLLSTITYPDGKKVTITYTSEKPTAVTLLDASGNSVYKVAYSYSNNRLYSVTEYGVKNGTFVQGAKSTYSYSIAAGRTIVQTTEQMDPDEDECYDNVIKTVYTFDDDGNIVSEYVYSEDTGNTGVDGEESGIHPYSGDGGVGVVSNINNLLTGHNFESLAAWPSMPGNCSDHYISNYAYEPYAKFGKKVLRMQSYQLDCVENGVYQVTNLLPAGQYTFSAYLRVLVAFSGIDAGAYIRVTNTSGKILGVSECLDKYDTEYTRLIVPFELTAAQSVQVQILVNGKGTVYADAAQLENNPYANAYNMLENGNFERGTDGWTKSSGVSYSIGTRFNMSNSLYMAGSLDANRYAYQEPAVRTTRSTRETFTLSGWAKGYGLPNHERDGITTPSFRLRAVIKYYDTYYREYGQEQFTADFSPCTEEWQFASVQFSKSKYRTIQYIRVYCDYGHNSGTAYFDDIQLVRNSIETNLSASDFVVESTGVSDDQVEENTDTTPAFNEAKDDFGNAITETTFTDGEFGTIYRAFGFTPECDCAENAGNDLVSETDARGNKTTYTVDEETSRNKEVIDRCDNKTAYEYDTAGKTTKVTSAKPQYDDDGNMKTDSNGEVMYEDIAHVSYAYDAFDNMTEIVRGDGMKYALAYNEFHNLESIGINGKTEKLIRYTYKNGNGRLKQMTYANGHTMKAVYNSVGQMVAEKWFATEAQAASSATPIAHYKYVYDGQGNIVQSIDITNKKCYNYEYEEGKIIRATESDITLSGEVVVFKDVVNTVKYYYDAEGKMTKKVITPASGSAQTVYYETTDDNTTVKFSAGGRTVTSHSKTDTFGRKVFDELQLGTDFVSRQFVYHVGKVTDEHKGNAKVKSSATTQLVSQIILSDERTLSYEYDEEERITSVTEKYTVAKTEITDTTSYTYDALGQLLTEKNVVQTVDRSEEEPIVSVTTKLVNAMEYDNYGNIVKKNGKVYTYGDADWKDLLTSYNGQAITYDLQGNPTTYLGHTLTWEKGRQLKTFVKSNGTVIDYTYNANGIRTGKTVGGVKHTYTLDGTKILRETWGSNTIVPMYDNEDSVCGIVYNNVPYYFVKNLQGDVIAIVNKDAETVARYSYDAWGVCTITQDTTDCNIASMNPYRYRGYYFDTEIGMYYLQSRYYDAGVGRFVNADEVIMLAITNDIVLGLNLFSHGFNDPVNQKDSTGFIVHAIIGAILGALLSALTYFVEYWLGMRNLNWWAFAGIVATAAALGAIGGYISGWAKFAKLAKYARLPGLFKKLKSPIVRNIVTWAVRGIKFLINGFVKKLSRKPGESWVTAIRRWLNI